jgi:hypothetical protein
VRLIFVLVALAGAGGLTIRHVQGHRHGIVIPVLLVPALVLGWFEYEDRMADQRLTHAASILAGHPVQVECQRLGGALLDMGSELGYVAYDQNGRPGDTTVIKHEACVALHDWMGSDKSNPTELEIIAVHVLAHEAEHLAGYTSEAVAECRSVQTTEQAALLLGANPAQARALAVSYWTDVYPRMSDDYRSGECHDGGSLDLHPNDPRWP